MKIAPFAQNKKCDHMIVFITVFGSLKEHFPPKTEMSIGETATLKAVLLEFAEKHNGKALLFDADENVRRHLVIQVNKKRVITSKADESKLQNGDEIILYPPVSGG